MVTYVVSGQDSQSVGLLDDEPLTELQSPELLGSIEGTVVESDQGVGLDVDVGLLFQASVAAMELL